MQRGVWFILSGSVVLAACSAPTLSVTATQNAVEAATSTVEPRPTRIAVTSTLPTSTEISPSPTVNPTPWWGAPPAQPIEAYTLTAWTAADALEWAAKDLSPYPANRRGVTYDDYDTGTFVAMTLYREAMIRDTGSGIATTARQALANPETYGWGSQTALEPFRETFERTLNAHEDETVTTTTVTSILAEVTGSDTLRVQRLLPIDNVLGNGEPGWVVDVRSTMTGAVLVIVSDAGTYRVLQMRPTWTTIAWNDYEVAAIDLNANGVSEVAIWDRYWGTGMSHFCDETYAAYEWQATAFTNLTAEVRSRALTDYGDCLPVESESTAAGPMTLTTGNIVSTGCSVDGDWTAAALVYKRRYGWNGRFFELADATLLPFPDLKPGDTQLAACALGWANQAGPEVPQARALMERVLDTTDPTLIEAFTAQFGPAYHDFFTFKLGTWYAQIGNGSKARALLTAVRDAPRAPEYAQASQLAAAFLEEDAAHGTFAACIAMDCAT